MKINATQFKIKNKLIIFSFTININNMICKFVYVLITLVLYNYDIIVYFSAYSKKKITIANVKIGIRFGLYYNIKFE